MSYQFDESEIVRLFLKFLEENGCAPRSSLCIIPDGEIHRYRVWSDDRRSERSGSYCLYIDGWPAGWARNWRIGETVTWTFPREALDDEGREYFTKENYEEAKKRSEIARKRRELEEKEHQEKARLEMSRIYFSREHKAEDDFPYLKRKGVKVFMGGIDKKYFDIRLNNHHLLIPLTNTKGGLCSFQEISEDGDKMFYYGVPTKGAFFGMGLDKEHFKLVPTLPIIIAEGYATAATIHEATTYLPTVAAMYSGNIVHVACELKKKYPGVRILIAADNDRFSKSGINTGIEAAKKAVKELDLDGYFFPDFASDEPGSDWNDFMLIHGMQFTSVVLKEKIEQGLRPSTVKALSSQIREINAEILRHKVFPPVKWAVPGFLPTGLTILGGGPKVGKSILALHVATAVAIGGCAFGKIDVEQGEVLYLALEDNERRLQDRLSASNLIPDDKEIDLSNLHLITAIPKQHEGGIKYLEYWLDAHKKKARLVIVDTLQMFRKPLSGKGGVYGEDYETAAALKNVADKYSVAMLVLHHLKKLNASDELTTDWVTHFSGSTGISGSADTLFVMKRTRSDKVATLQRTGRDVEEGTFKLKIDGFGVLLEESAEAFTMPEWKRQILDYLKEHGTITPMEVIRTFDLNENTAKSNLRRLVKEGAIVKVGYGTYTLPQNV